jgi:hypothetical protein
MTDLCIVEGCGRQAKPRSALCSGHHKRRALGQPMCALCARRQSTWEAIWAAIFAFAEAAADDDEAFLRAKERVRAAVKRHVKARLRA